MSKAWIVGLGNPGTRYEKTRHNAGFMAVSKLVSLLKAEAGREKHQSLFSRAEVGETSAFLILPQTFMNLSGDCLLEWKRREGLQPEGLLVLYDDMDLPLGKLRLRKEGSGGSHNGMASIIERLGTQNFARLRMGIGKPANPEDWADFVTKPFDASEREIMAAMVEKAAQAAKDWIQEPNTERLMSRVNA